MARVWQDSITTNTPNTCEHNLSLSAPDHVWVTHHNTFARNHIHHGAVSFTNDLKPHPERGFKTERVATPHLHVRVVHHRVHAPGYEVLVVLDVCHNFVHELNRVPEPIEEDHVTQHNMVSPTPPLTHSLMHGTHCGTATTPAGRTEEAGARRACAPARTLDVGSTTRMNAPEGADEAPYAAQQVVQADTEGGDGVGAPWQSQQQRCAGYVAPSSAHVGQL